MATLPAASAGTVELTAGGEVLPGMKKPIPPPPEHPNIKTTRTANNSVLEYPPDLRMCIPST
jgi:hypothetical protein